jgi:hypothetical protein
MIVDINQLNFDKHENEVKEQPTTVLMSCVHGFVFVHAMLSPVLISIRYLGC